MPGRRVIQIIVIIGLVVSLGFTSTAAFAYWQDVSDLGNVQIEFGDSDANLEVEITSPPFTQKLVPEGHAYFVGEVEEVLMSYEVYIDKELAQTMNLVVEATSVTIGELEVYSHLVEITIDGSRDKITRDIFNSVVTVNVVVRLIEPIDAAEAVALGLDPESVNVEDSRAAYEAIKGQTVGIVLSFRIEPKTQEN